MIDYVYFNVCLTMRTPNEEGIKVSFKDRMDDIVYATKKFNSRFKGYKEIKIVDVTDINEIILLLEIQDLIGRDVKDINARELSYFSKRLAHDKEWQKYSRVRSSLFTATVFERFDKENDIAKYKELPVFPDEYYPSVDDFLDIDVQEELTDEEAIEVFKSLLVVQNIGDSEAAMKRQTTIEQIKMLLVEAFK